MPDNDTKPEPKIAQVGIEAAVNTKTRNIHISMDGGGFQIRFVMSRGMFIDWVDRWIATRRALEDKLADHDAATALVDHVKDLAGDDKPKMPERTCPLCELGKHSDCDKTGDMLKAVNVSMRELCACAARGHKLADTPEAKP